MKALSLRRLALIVVNCGLAGTALLIWIDAPEYPTSAPAQAIRPVEASLPSAAIPAVEPLASDPFGSEEAEVAKTVQAKAAPPSPPLVSLVGTGLGEQSFAALRSGAGTVYTATLKVGDQVPIATRSAQGVINPDAPVVNDIQLKDTGVILSVTPRVNASGLVQLDISQEVSDVVATTTSSIDSPTIRLRKIDSSVAVASGEEIVLGGLIGTRREKTDSGVPLLMDIPILGNAFKTNAGRKSDRSELLIILRPTVMASRSDIDAVTRAVRSGMSATSRAIGR